MLSLKTLRKIDPSLAHLTDEELEQMRDYFYEFGQLIFDDYHAQKHSSKNPFWSLTNNGESNKM